MQFLDSSTKLGIVEQIDFLCDTDSTSFPTAQKVREVNAALEQVIGLIIGADGRWEWDDTNHTDLPIGTFTLVEGQESYTFSTDFLQIVAVEQLNLAGDKYVRMRPLDHTELDGLSPDEYFGTDSSGNPRTGIPQYYDQIGDTIFLYPAPAAANVSLTNGLKVYYKRTVNLFTASDTTQEPGFASPYHSVLSYMASLPFCMKFKKDRVALYRAEVTRLTKDMMAFYGQREQDRKKIFRTRFINFR